MNSDFLIFIVYSCLLLGFIYFTSFFNLFKDSDISKKKLSLFFLGKLIAVPTFLFVYTKTYGGIENFDTGKFYHDAIVISEYGKTDFNFLIRFLFGLQDDSPGSLDYEHVLKNTLNWDNGTVKDYLYNDNRIVIKLHVFLNFIAFNSYLTHALFNCFLSFIGMFFFYKTFKEWFVGKEIWLLLVLCFFPALWFYTGALLKEGIAFFILGCTLWQLKKVLLGNKSLKALMWLLCLLFLSLLMKPYLLVFAAICFALFFSIYNSERIKRKLLFFFSAMLAIVFLLNVLSLTFKQRSLLGAALKHQHLFVGVSKGGIFLFDDDRFIRLNNDTSQVKRIEGAKDRFSIRKNATYMYWKTGNLNDTLYCEKNEDTSSVYELAYIIQQSKSNIELPQSNPVYILAACFYYTLFYPSFFNASNAMQLLASLENLIVFASLLFLIFYLIKSKKEKFLALVFIFFALSLCLLIGLTAPNSGAIFRYRSPAMIFLILSALYFLPFGRLTENSASK